MVDKKTALINKQKERILSAARECFIDKGLSKTTMRDIAAQTNMSLGNIYRYFKNKDILIQEFIEKDNQSLDEVFPLLDNCQNFKLILKEFVAGFIKEIYTTSAVMIYTDILSEALHNDSILELIELGKAEQLLSKALDKAAKDKKIQLNLDAKTTANTIIAMINRTAMKCLIDESYSIQTAKKQMNTLIDLLMEEE